LETVRQKLCVVLSQMQLQESGSSVVQPSQVLSLTCAISGDTVSSKSVTWKWLRQPPGKGLQWPGRMYYMPRWYKDYPPSLQGRLVMDSDMSKNQLSLQLSSATTKDMAMYYCARDRVSGHHCEPRHKPPCRDTGGAGHRS
uniref:Ig-like domain-containing protein n=1 Tax=Lynx canadensis TaxID=61383 RepID=A0A667FVT4_LYNCA